MVFLFDRVLDWQSPAGFTAHPNGEGFLADTQGAPSSHSSCLRYRRVIKGHQTFIIGKGKLSTIKPTDQNSPKGWLNAICLETMVLGIQRGFSWIMRHMQKCSTFLTALC